MHRRKKNSLEKGKGRAQQEWLTQKWLPELAWDSWGGLTGRVLRYLDITRGLIAVQGPLENADSGQCGKTFPGSPLFTGNKFLASVQGLFAPGSFTLVSLSSAINSTSKLPQPCLATPW